jgi:hypothetical protein
VSEVKVAGHPENTSEYIWGDKTLRIVRCKACGVTTHWEPLAVKPDSKMGVNAINFEPEALGHVRVRPFDGADTWKFLD